MEYVAVDSSGIEAKYDGVPERHYQFFNWVSPRLDGYREELEIGSIEKLIGKKRTWEDEP